MKEEQNGTSKNNWSRIFKKKWFFPAVYLIVAVFLLTIVVWYQGLDKQVPNVQESPSTSDDFQSNEHGEEATPVIDQQEVIKMPLANLEQAEIVTKFYDYDAEQEDKEMALILFNNRFHQSTGIDITSADDEDFSVQASLSGTVTEVKKDPVLGNVVVMTHGNDVMTYYSSLGEVDVKANSKVKQGDVIGTAGKSRFGQENGTHVHFEIRKNEIAVNPEMFFNQPVSKLDEIETNEDKPVEKEEQEQAEEQLDREQDDQEELME